MRRVGLPLAFPALLVALVGSLPGASTVHATVLLAKDEALALAFPGNDRVEERVVILTDAQKEEMTKHSFRLNSLKAHIEEELKHFIYLKSLETVPNACFAPR